jgi:hypothetical protein
MGLPFQPPPAGSQERQPEPQKRRHAGEHDQRTPRIVVKRPGTRGVKETPDDNRRHDPGDDAFGAGGVGFAGVDISEKDTPTGPRVTSRPQKTKAPGTVQIPGGRGS